MTVQKFHHAYQGRNACDRLFDTKDPEVLLSGPAGTGKSRACLEKLHIMALLNPGMRGLICRKTAATLSSTALVTWRRFVCNESLLSGDVTYYGGSKQEPSAYRYSNGSIISIGGLDNINKIMSSEYDVIYVQEATELTENDWESLSTRLRNWVVSFQQIIGDCNPAQPTHWLKQRCDKRQCALLETWHEDNPQLFDDEGNVTERGKDYIRKLDNLTGVRHERLRMGRWAAVEGVIYEEFSPEVHILPSIPISNEPVDWAGVPLSWTRYWSVDFGYVNPFVLQCWAEDGDGRLYLYREIYHTHQTVDVHAKNILAIVRPEGRWREPKPSVVVCDHDAEGRAVLERELGLSTQPAHKSVLEGIDAVKVRLLDPGDGRRRLYLLRNAVVKVDPELAEGGKPTCTVDEIPGYVWNNKGKDEPTKADDHGCDALRYIVAEKDFGIRAMYRSFSV